jgi:hypothetical protein
MDDESYFTLSHSTINGNNNFYTSDMNSTPASVKYQTAAKYESKLLVWIAASPKGLSKPFIVPNGLAINQYIYTNECLSKRLIPFLNAHHSDGEYVFWPDLATSHYADSTMDFMIENSINFVEKFENPANTPEVRPIEDFWSILKGHVYEGGWRAENLEQLKRRIKLCLKKLDTPLIHALFQGTRGRLDRVRRFGMREDSN